MPPPDELLATTGEALASPSAQAKLRGLTAAFSVLLALSIMLTLTAVVYLTYQGKVQSEQAKVQSEQNAIALMQIQQVNRRLTDCNEPGGKCYKATEARNAAQVGAINAATIATAYCINRSTVKTYTDLVRCVGRFIGGRNKP